MEVYSSGKKKSTMQELSPQIICWGDSSARTRLATWSGGPVLHLQDACRKPSGTAHGRHPSAGEVGKEDPQELSLASHSHQLESSGFSERLLLKI